MKLTLNENGLSIEAENARDGVQLGRIVAQAECSGLLVSTDATGAFAQFQVKGAGQDDGWIGDAAREINERCMKETAEYFRDNHIATPDSEVRLRGYSLGSANLERIIQRHAP